jgi:hypothetical protein
VKQTPAVVGYLYRSDAQPERNETVCSIIDRAYDPIHSDGDEPTFIVRFADGYERVVRADALRPWYPL